MWSMQSSSATRMSSSWLRNVEDKKLNVDLMTLFDLYTAVKDPLDHILKDVELPELKELLETIIPILQCADADITNRIETSPRVSVISNNSEMITSSLEKKKRSVNRSRRSDGDAASSESSSSDESTEKRRRRRKKKTKKPAATASRLMPAATDILLQSITTCALDVFAQSTLFSE